MRQVLKSGYSDTMTREEFIHYLEHQLLPDLREMDFHLSTDIDACLALLKDPNLKEVGIAWDVDEAMACRIHRPHHDPSRPVFCPWRGG